MDGVNDCQHILGDGSTLIVAADGCSLECTVCNEIVVSVEPISFFIADEEIEWVG
jgi:hypothetical protein